MLKLYNILFLTESRTKAFEKVMRQVYSHLPDLVFRDMYSQEKQNQNIFDQDIGPQIQTLTADVLANKPNAVENFKEFERQRQSEWINTSWESKQAKQINLSWNELSQNKKNFFKNKYLGKNEFFPPRTKDKHGYLDKIERILKSQTSSLKEPVILLKRKSQDGYDIIGGNNRVFNAFLLIALKNLKIIDSQNLDKLDFQQVFNNLDQNNPLIQINAYVGKEV